MFLPYAQNIYDLRPYFPDFDAFLRTVDAWPVTCRVRIEDDVVLLEESEILDIAETLLTDEKLARLEDALRTHVIGR